MILKHFVDFVVVEMFAIFTLTPEKTEKKTKDTMRWSWLLIYIQDPEWYGL